MRGISVLLQISKGFAGFLIDRRRWWRRGKLAAGYQLLMILATGYRLPMTLATGYRLLMILAAGY